ncbi:myosin-6-like [Dorcoceras hygrometricum]|uniref:Myosin-6-like n=1 Tax=Dorcoceras hygrometricum TaxID=472368 RepID=A0A2Z6ZWF0_9LAMI|nr:myosin-6-like [Dorcoceras hygrometricum]
MRRKNARGPRQARRNRAPSCGDQQATMRATSSDRAPSSEQRTDTMRNSLRTSAVRFLCDAGQLLHSCGQRATRSGTIARQRQAERRDIARPAAPFDRLACAGHGQPSRAMRGQRTSVARVRARGDEDGAPPCAAAPWPMRR